MVDGDIHERVAILEEIVASYRPIPLDGLTPTARIVYSALTEGRIATRRTIDLAFESEALRPASDGVVNNALWQIRKHLKKEGAFKLVNHPSIGWSLQRIEREP